MAWSTLREITQDTISNLSQAGGVGTQRYAQPRIELLVNQCFGMLFNRQWWPQFMKWYNLPLDGASGVVVGDISAITRFADIRAVFLAGSSRPMPVLPLELNPYDIPSGQLVFLDSNDDDEKVFKVWSPTATGTLAIHGRQQPNRYTSDNTVRFDALALTYGAAWAYAEDDGTNPGASEKFQKLFVNRVTDLEVELTNKPIALNKTASFVPDQWWVQP